MNRDGKGQVITFYSYKGGNGRTMALANVAWIMASNGKRVLVVDWDLESPGLHKYFHPFLDESVIRSTPGVIEIISDYAWAATRPNPKPRDWHLEYARVLRHAVSLSWDHFPEGGTLDLISAGRQNRDFSAAVSAIDWDNFYSRLGGGKFFRAMRTDMKENYDYVLIDSRTGLSDVADICTVELPDTLIVCFTLNDQSIDGGSSVAHQISGRYHDRNIQVLPVPMRIEDGEKEKLDVGRALARGKFADLPAGLSAEDSALYWQSVEIPYKPFYAFEETLATFGDDPGSPLSLLAAFERLTGGITAGEITAMPPLAEDLRAQYREAFTRHRPPPTAEVLVSYAPEDRMWADWIESVLTRSGCHVRPHSTLTVTEGMVADETSRSLQTATHVIVILSPAYLRSAGGRRIWDAAADPAGTHRHLVPVRVSEVRLSAPFAERTPVDLVGLDAQEAAAQLLQALDRPVHSVQRALAEAGNEPRFPVAIAPIWNVLPRNVAFTGRAANLEGLRDTLAGGGRPVALYGLGGVGKTQLALEYAHRFVAAYDLVWWVPAERADQIVPELAELAPLLGIEAGENMAEAAKAVLATLRQGEAPQRWLLIFDNADDPRQLEPYLPTGPGHVLITSRNRTWSQLAEPLEVDVFTREESIEHLRLRVPELGAEDADRVAEALGDLPLAVEQAGAWLRETGMPAVTYAEQLETGTARVLVVSQHPVVTAWNLSFEWLRERSPAAVRLLQLCAFFSPGPISMTLLYSDELIRALIPYDQSLHEKVMLGRVIRDISRFALIKVDQGSNSIQIHRLVQAVIRSQLTEEEQLAACHTVHTVLVGARPSRGDTDDPGNWPRFELIWPHLEPSRAAECTEESTRQLLIDWVRYLWKQGQFEAGLQLALRLDALWTELFGADHRQTLHLRFHIANLLRSCGRFQEARELDADVLARQRAALPADHPHTLMTAAGLAADLRGLGEYREALERDRDTYERFGELLGEDHPRTLAAAHNLGVSLRLVGDYATALELDRQTLARRRLVLGPSHPYTLYSAADVARGLRDTGEFRGSVELLRPNLATYQKVLGNDLLDTLRTAKSLAVSLRKVGDYQEASRLTQSTYERYLRWYGREAPDALSCALNLACDHSALGDNERAREGVEEVREAYRLSLGEDHPLTLVAASNLLTYLRRTGAVAEARGLAEQTLRTMGSRLGEDHPFTLLCAANLANCLADLGELDAAEARGRQTAVQLAAKLGPHHPDTLICEANLAVTLHQTGQDLEAVQIRERVLDEFGRVLGERHPTVTLLRAWQRIDCDLEAQPI